MENTEWVALHDLAGKTVNNLGKKGTAEAFFTVTDTTEIVIRNSEILTQNRIHDAGIGIRACINNKVGFACTNRITEEDITKTGEKALLIANVSSEVPDFALPVPGNLPRINVYDTKIADVTVEEAIDTAKRALISAEDYDPRVSVKSGLVLFQSGWRGVVNTLGVDCEEKETKAVIYLGGIGEYKDEVTGTCYDYAFSRCADINPESVGEAVGKKVCDMFHPKPVKKIEGTVIFGPEAGSYQLTEVLIDALRGDTVMAGRSVWTAKIGEMVASDLVTITDNGVLTNGFSSRQFDDEGHPSQNTVLVEHGELKGFIHHALSAHALTTDDTGNASRYPGGFDMVRNIVGTGYRTEPEIYSSNLVIEPGTKTKEDLISEVTKGVLIESMAGFPQAGSGLISAQLSRAFFIKNGEIKHPVKGMVSGVGYDWFKTISGVGNDAKQFQNVVTPSIRVEGVTVVG